MKGLFNFKFFIKYGTKGNMNLKEINHFEMNPYERLNFKEHCDIQPVYTSMFAQMRQYLTRGEGDRT